MARRAVRRSITKPRRAVRRSSAASRTPVRARRSARAVRSGRNSPTTVRVVIQQAPAAVTQAAGAVSMDTLKKARF